MPISAVSDHPVNPKEGCRLMPPRQKLTSKGLPLGAQPSMAETLAESLGKAKGVKLAPSSRATHPRLAP